MFTQQLNLMLQKYFLDFKWSNKCCKRIYSWINGPGCVVANEKSIVFQSRISEIKSQGFEAFFMGRDNVMMSSLTKLI